MVGHFTYNLFSYSGAAYQAHSLIKSLGTRNNMIFNIGHSNVFKLMNHDGVIVADLPKNYLKRLYYIIFISLTCDIKIFHMHGWILSALLPAIFLRKKVVFKCTMFGDDDLKTIGDKGRLNRFLLKFIDVCIAISSPIKEANDFFISKNELKIKSIKIANGVQLNAPCNTKSKPIFCTVGVITERKRIKESIRYFIDNYSHEEEALLYVVGPRGRDFNLHEGNDNYYQECLDLASEAKGKVKFTGKISKDDLSSVFKESIGLIFFSEKEGMPNVVLEAMSHNCVPILSEIDGVAYDLVDHGHSGFIISENKVNDISLNSLKSISHKEMPYQKVAKYFSFDVIKFKHLDNYALIGKDNAFNKK